MRGAERNRLEWEEIVRRAREARKARDHAQWAIGDLACDVEVVYGEGSLQRFAEAVDVGYLSMLDYRRVSRAYRSSERTKDLPWSHYRLLCKNARRGRWLQRAVDER